jgi:hypothetical protein
MMQLPSWPTLPTAFYQLKFSLPQPVNSQLQSSFAPFWGLLDEVD